MTDTSFSRALIINGSARTNGDTAKLVQEVISCLKFSPDAYEIVELCRLRIAPYSYETPVDIDDFISLIERCCVSSHIIIATPIYWYTVSTHTKIFLDRLTDLLYHHTALKQRLAGRSLGVVTSFASRTPKFAQETQAYMDWMFQGICDYMRLKYLGSYFHQNSAPYPIQREALFSLSDEKKLS